MSVNPFVGVLDAQALLDLQGHQYDTIIPIQQSIPAQSALDLTVNVGSEGHFQMWGFTLGYTTLTAGPADAGINGVFMQLLDGTQGRTLFTGNVNAALIASPGRLRGSAAVGTADEPLRVSGFRFRYMFPKMGTIIMRCRNDLTNANIVSIAYFGTRIRVM